MTVHWYFFIGMFFAGVATGTAPSGTQFGASLFASLIGLFFWPVLLVAAAVMKFRSGK